MQWRTPGSLDGVFSPDGKTLLTVGDGIHVAEIESIPSEMLDARRLQARVQAYVANLDMTMPQSDRIQEAERDADLDDRLRGAIIEHLQVENGRIHTQ